MIEHTITKTREELTEELARVKAQLAEKWTEEEVLTAIGTMGNEFTALFEKEAAELVGHHDSESIGKRMAYEACALAMIKGTTRKMIVWPEVKIKFTVPSEAKP